MIWLDKEMCWEGPAIGRRKLSRKCRKAAIPTCLTAKAVLNLTRWEEMGMALSLLKLAGLDWEAPEISIASCRQSSHHNSSAKPTTTGSHLPIESADITSVGKREWKTQKHVAEQRGG